MVIQEHLDGQALKVPLDGLLGSPSQVHPAKPDSLGLEVNLVGRATWAGQEYLVGRVEERKAHVA